MFSLQGGVLTPLASWGIGDAWLASHSAPLLVKEKPLANVTLSEADTPKKEKNHYAGL